MALTPEEEQRRAQQLQQRKNALQQESGGVKGLSPVAALQAGKARGFRQQAGEDRAAQAERIVREQTVKQGSRLLNFLLPGLGTATGFVGKYLVNTAAGKWIFRGCLVGTVLLVIILVLFLFLPVILLVLPLNV